MGAFKGFVILKLNIVLMNIHNSEIKCCSNEQPQHVLIIEVIQNIHTFIAPFLSLDTLCHFPLLEVCRT